MADQEVDEVMQDLQRHLQNANVKVTSLSNIAKNGDEKLVEQFLSETIFVRSPTQDIQGLANDKADILTSQLYIACFWGFTDVVKGILDHVDAAKKKGLDIDVNCQNKKTKWTPLHAATFQEHGPVIMHLLRHGANPQLEDSEGRSPKDFASASDKIWGHFAAEGLKRTPKATLIEMGIIRKLGEQQLSSPRNNSHQQAAGGITMAAYSRPESDYAYSDDPFVHAAATGDVLANEDNAATEKQQQPQFMIYK